MHRSREPIQTLEPRKLLASVDLGFNGAPTLIAVADQDSFDGLTSRSISYYDVSGVDEAAARNGDADPSNDVALFDKTPLFTIFTGFELTGDVPGGPEDYEEINAFDVNPINGDTYVLGFDSTGGGQANPANPADPANFDSVGDGLGDYDLYRFNVGLVYNDFVTNGRSAGTMYMPQIAPDGFDYYAAFGVNPMPAVTGSSIGIPDGRDNTDADTTNDLVILPGVSEKIGEIARIQGDEGTNEPDFFNNQEISFVDADTLVLMENLDLGDDATPDGIEDFQIRTIRRLSTASGATTGIVPGPSGDADDFVGGRTPLSKDAGQPNYVPAGTPLTTESWAVQALTGVYPDNFLGSDTDTLPDTDATGAFVRLDGTGSSEVDGMRYVPFSDATPARGVAASRGGVWVSERDGEDLGDEFAFFEIDFLAGTATLRELQVGAGPFPTNFNLDEDPDLGDNAGDVGFFDVDENGDLYILEENFQGNTNPLTTNPQIIVREIVDYNAGDSDSNMIDEIQVGGFADSDALVNTVTDDTPSFPDLVDDRFGVFVRGQGYLYLMDSDGSADDDVYVFDADPNSPTFGEVVYEELDGWNHFLRDGQRMRAFTLGDYDAQDGVVGPADADALQDAINGGLTLSQQEALDLTGDDLLMGGAGGMGATSDFDSLITKVVGTFFADFNFDGRVDLSDFVILRNGFGSGTNYSQGDANISGTVDLADFVILRNNFGNNADDDNNGGSIFA